MNCPMCGSPRVEASVKPVTDDAEGEPFKGELWCQRCMRVVSFSFDWSEAEAMQRLRDGLELTALLRASR